MPLPLAGIAAVASAARALKGGKGLLATARGGPRRRRRRRRLTAGQLNELAQIKAILGKTAAANALPFYLR